MAMAKVEEVARPCDERPIPIVVRTLGKKETASGYTGTNSC